jgi:GNAT superfamily N-acetyltransferase
MTLALRRLRDGDVAAWCATANRSHEHDRVPHVQDEAELREELEPLDHAEDVRVAELDGAPVGFAHVWFVPSGERLERAYVFGTVDPSARGRGAGRALLTWGIERATDLLRATGNDLPKFVRADAYEHVTDACRLFAACGMEPVRWFEELRRPLADPLTVNVDDPYVIEPWPRDRDEELRVVRNRAFADHWGSTPWPPERFQEIATSMATRLDLSVIAVHRPTGRIVGVCLNEHYPQDGAVTGRVDGWISTLGTLREHRAHGLASAMIAASFERFRAAGFTHAALGVDGDSPTGAHRLYRALGFELALRGVTYQREVT